MEHVFCKYFTHTGVWARANGFHEKRCTESEWYGFDIVNKLPNKQQLAVYSYTKNGCVSGCNDATRVYLGRLNYGEHISNVACRLEVYVAVLVPTHHLDHEDDFVVSLEDEDIIYSTKQYVVNNDVEQIMSKEIIINGRNHVNSNGHSNTNIVQPMQHRYAWLSHKWINHWKLVKENNWELQQKK